LVTVTVCSAAIAGKGSAARMRTKQIIALFMIFTLLIFFGSRIKG
jgi:hypothetical protein